MADVKVDAENIIKLEEEIKEEPEEENIEDGNEVYLDFVEDIKETSIMEYLPCTTEDLAAVDAGYLSPMEEELEEEIKPPLAIFLESNMESQEEEEGGGDAAECEQDPLFVGLDVFSIKKENTSDCIKEEVVSDSDVGDIGDTIQSEDNATISQMDHRNEPMRKQAKARSSQCEESVLKSAERLRSIMGNSEGPITRDAACQRSVAAKAHTTDHTYVLLADKLCQCEVCRMSFEPKSPNCGDSRDGKPNTRIVMKRRLKKILVNEVVKNVHPTKFFCRTCKTYFKSRANLSRHELVHNRNEEGLDKMSSKNDINRLIPLTELLPYACEICGLRFSRRGNLTRHRLFHHTDNVNNGDGGDSKEPGNIRKRLKTIDDKDCDTTKKGIFTCYICKKIIKSKLGYSQHMYAHRTRNGSCESIDLSLSKERPKKESDKHIISQQMEKKNLCEICNLKFTFRRDLTQHMLTHHDDGEENNKPNSCSFNENKSISGCIVNSIAEQKLEHTNISSQDCDEETNSVNKTLSSECADKQYSLRTTQEAFYCGICKNAFKLKINLTRHLNSFYKKQRKNTETTQQSSIALIHINSKEKPYGCNICKMTFDASVQLSGHMRLHPKQTFADFICEQTFLFPESGSKISNSYDKKMYECGVCKQLFDSNEPLTQHMSTHKTNEDAIPISHIDAKDFSRHLSVCKKLKYYCKVCKHTFGSSEELSEHSSVHTKNSYYCNICKESFDSNQQKPSQHLSKHKYYCAPCKTTFYGNQNHYRHQRMHRKIYVCLHCKQSFLTHQQLSLHMRIHEWRKKK